MISPTLQTSSFSAQQIRGDFPILQHKVHGRALVYLDNGATTQKPRAVIEAERHFYENQNANIHRAAHALSQVATHEYEEARHTLQKFLNAGHPEEIIFTRGTTESINLVASSLGRLRLGAGDEVLISTLEHHSNIVPWQIACEIHGATLKVIPINDAGEIRLDEYEKLLSGKTRIISIVHVSNSLGTINPVQEMIAIARRKTAAAILIDGAQAAGHFPIDVQKLDCDFYALSGHKMFGPTGIGVLYGKRDLLNAMPPYQGGGDMIESVSFAKTVYAQLPNKFEAGTPNIAGAIGMGAAARYLLNLDREAVVAYEHELLSHAQEKLSQIKGVRVIGTASSKAGVVSFVVDDPPLSMLDVGMALDRAGIAVRTGHHCCQPLMECLKIPGTARASFSMYNTKQEADFLVAELSRIIESARTAKAQAKTGASGGKTDITFFSRFADSPAKAADELAGDFELLGDRESKTSYVLDLGAQLPHHFEQLKPLTPRVPGCMSEVYLIGRPVDGKVQYVADANADIVRGLIAVVMRLFSGQSPAEILKFDVEGFFHRIGLDEFITTQRRNGLSGMVRKIRDLAESYGKK